MGHLIELKQFQLLRVFHSTPLTHWKTCPNFVPILARLSIRLLEKLLETFTPFSWFKCHTARYYKILVHLEVAIKFYINISFSFHYFLIPQLFFSFVIDVYNVFQWIIPDVAVATTSVNATDALPAEKQSQRVPSHLLRGYLWLTGWRYYMT